MQATQPVISIPRATYLPLLSLSNLDPHPAFQRDLQSPPPHFLVLAFVREHRSSSRGSYFSYMTECAKWEKNDVGFPNFKTTTVLLSTNIRIDNGFWREALQMVWSGVAVNVYR
ncbi:hypothetical protein AVEN_83185-1 [Araneus ventricosus]|uniref:Uncharacterized protein n=1 Tax=Araneus ventricosus TaxID=182803 RepID=A0A4Y2APH0_ARAVE|nr:hypothetical protein AVEN_83185-1 [Araneus ventricosus]